MKKVIILGGAGFIGLNIVKYLIAQRNYKITVFWIIQNHMVLIAPLLDIIM